MGIRKILLFVFTCSFFVGLLTIGFNINIFNKKIDIVSPVPSFLTITDNKQVSTLDIWQPLIEAFFSSSEEVPEISAKSALVYDITLNKALFTKNAGQRLPMASLTKIMTAIIAIENKKPDDKYRVSKDNLVGEDSMGLSREEILSLNELLYGLMLVSGNDAAETIAANFPGGREKFIAAMNNKAKAFGLKNTHFANPTGLEGDGDQYTTVHDLLVITDYALRFEQFSKVVKTFQYHIPYTLSHKEFYLENVTNLLTSYPGVKGVKTGFTPEAGFCLVTYLDYKGHKIIGIILGSDNRRQEMKDLLDYSLKLEGITPPSHS